MTERNAALSAFKEALPYTLPVFAGFWFIAFAYGFYMYTLGFSFLYPLFMAMFIFGGSLEFITVTMLLSPFAPWQTFIIAFTVQARHLFYGLAMLEKYEGMGWKKPFLIYWMCDETFCPQLFSNDSKWYRQKLVHVLGIIFKLCILGKRRGHRRPFGKHHYLQYKGTELCHDFHVPCHFS